MFRGWGGGSEVLRVRRVVCAVFGEYLSSIATLLIPPDLTNSVD